jgi:hypothetical protein
MPLIFIDFQIKIVSNVSASQFLAARTCARTATNKHFVIVILLVVAPGSLPIFSESTLGGAHISVYWYFKRQWWHFENKFVHFL